MTEQQQEQQLDRKDLMIMAYKEKLSELEHQVAEFRVDLTIQNQQLQEALQRLSQYENESATDDAKSEEA